MAHHPFLQCLDVQSNPQVCVDVHNKQKEDIITMNMHRIMNDQMTLMCQNKKRQVSSQH